MNSRVFWAGSVLAALGFGLLLWKALVLEAPLLPSGASEVWQVEVAVTLRGENGAGGVRIQLPNSRGAQRIYREHFRGDGLDVTTRRRPGAREALWTGPIDGVHRIAYRFTARRFNERVELPQGTPEGPFLDAPDIDPALDEAFRAVFEELDLPPASDFAGRVRSLFAFATHEIHLSPIGSDDPVLALDAGEANAVGKEALLVGLLRSAGASARPVEGLELVEGRPRLRRWSEVWTGTSWFPLSASQGFFGDLPPRLLALSTTGTPLVESTGAVVSMAQSFRAIQIPLSEAEYAALAVPDDPWFARFSLYQLPVSSQSALRLLLLLPLGALAIALLRNVVGIPGYGTFMPMLIALALRGTGLATGLLLVGIVLAAGVVSRLAIERLHLLLVPRLGFILCVVILSVTALSLSGRELDQANFYAGGLFPIVILTMLVERFSIRAAEEGLRSAGLYAAYSVAMAVVLYPIFESRAAEHLMFSFPELVLVAMGLLVWTGGYTGYRITDWARFAMLARNAEQEGTS